MNVAFVMFSAGNWNMVSIPVNIVGSLFKIEIGIETEKHWPAPAMPCAI